MKVYDLSGKVLIDASCDVQMPMGCSKEVFEVMSVAGGESPVKFVFLTLSDASGNVVARNEYVLAQKKDKHDWAKYRWWRTQVESYADFSALNTLACAKVAASVTKVDGGFEVTLTNEAPVVAFFVRMALKDADGEYVLPAYWNDNLVSLAPGQSLTYKCTADIPAGASLTVEGWNVASETIGL